MIEIQRALIEAGLLPEDLPQNFTFRRVREILAEMETVKPAKLSAAVDAATRLQISAPLAAIIFIKHHLSGAHQVEVDRVAENEEQRKRYAVLVYPEGEVTVGADFLPDKIREGTLLSYDPDKGEYSL